MHCTILPEAKEHNTAMRHHAEELGLKMNEYGLFQEENQEEIFLVKMNGEVFQALGMPYIIPELRENTGEKLKLH